MRINVYTEELLADVGPHTEPKVAEIVIVEYTSSRTGMPMKNHGLRIYLKSHPDLHYIPGRDDDRSAVTFWCGPKERNVFEFLENIKAALGWSSLTTWHDKTTAVQADAAEAGRRAMSRTAQRTAWARSFWGCIG